MAELTRAQVIASSFQQAKEEPPVNGLIMGLGVVVALFVVIRFVHVGMERRRLAKRKKEQEKRERMGAGR